MDVGGWLRSLGLGEYEERFRDNKIDADVLADLTDGDLEKLGLPARRPQTITELAQSPAMLGVARTGVIKSIGASDGAHVVAGQVRVALDCGPLEKEIDVRVANLAAEAVLNASSTGRGLKTSQSARRA